MFSKRKSDPKLNAAIDDVYQQMDATVTDPDEYAKLVEHLQKLYEIRDNSSGPSVSPDTLVLAAANLIGIAMIVGYERANVVTSKAVGLVHKLI